jgi:kynurenine 3-monooxygenase
MTSNNNANSNNENNNGNKTVVIVGGGPSGGCAAKAMSDRGYNVNLYEAYPHPKDLSKTSSKAYIIALGRRGQQGIYDSTGFDLTKFTEEGAVISTDMARHSYDSKKNITKVKVISRGTKSLIVPRKVLAGCLLDAATESGVRVHYQHRLVDVDFENKIATFVVIDSSKLRTSGADEEKDTTMIDVKYDLLIGADGSRSKVRNLMVADIKTLKDFTARTEEDSMEYQVVVLPESLHDNNADTPDGTMHAWNNKEYNAICLAWPLVTKQSGDNNDNKINKPSTLFAIVFPEGNLQSFRETEDGYRAPLTALLPDIVDEGHLSEIAKQLRENEIANGGLCVWSSSLGNEDGGVILLGDSGHSMWPSLGQGCNCALESVAVFTRCLDELSKKKKKNDGDEKDWTRELVKKFNNARFEDATAAVDLTYGGIGARKSRGRENSPLSYKLQIGGMMLLHKLIFGIVPMPALLRLMKGSEDLSYSTARNYNFYYEKIICLGALAGAAVIFPKMWSLLRGSYVNVIGNEL